MDHVVFYPASDGTPGFHRLSSLEEAVRLVEHLRNVEGVDGVTLHALTEVPLHFKAYYRVELPTPLDVPSQAAAPAAEAASVPVVVLEPAPGLADVPPLELLQPVAALLPEPVAGEAPVELAPEPVPALALVEDVPVEAVLAPEPRPEPEQETAYAGNGHAAGGVASLGFFA